MSNISNRPRVVLISTGPIGPPGTSGAAGPSGSSQPFTEVSTGTWSTATNLLITGSVTVKGHLLPGGPYTNNTSSFDLGSSTKAWRDLYVSNGTIRFISGSNTAALSFTNGNLIVSGANISASVEGLVSDVVFNSFTSSINTQLTNIKAVTSSISALNDTTSSLLTVSRYESDSGSFNDKNNAVLILAQNVQSDLDNYITSNDIAIANTDASVAIILGDYITSADLISATVRSSSFAATASYISPTFISASAAASGFGSGGGDTSNLVSNTTFNSFTSSINTWTGSINSTITNFAVLDNANNFNGTQTINGTLHGNVEVVTEDTQSILDCSIGNFFTLDLQNGSTTTIVVDSISAGQTVNLLITMGGGNTVNLDNHIKQSSTAYSPSQTAGNVDILTFISFDGSTVYMSYVTNLA